MASAAILVGGRATRFGGRDKSALRIAGRSILERQIAEISKVTDDILLIGPPPQCDLPPFVRVVPDRVADSGPLGGLDAALAGARDHELLLLACDMPCVTAALLEHLLASARDADIVVPRTERGYHPLCAAYTHACRPAVARRLAERRLSMVGLFEDVRVRVIERSEIERFGDPDQVLANVNTPADFGELDALLSHKM
jgi:molybdopterin-guanine dinucleotide biosynthesis protein A